MTELVLEGSVRARACANIAVIKYWGKAPDRRPQDANLPAVPSLSLTLDRLWSESTVCFDPESTGDSLSLDGMALGGDRLARAAAVLDRVRELGDLAAPFRVESVNHVPTAAGLASSASGMAALAAAAARCAGLGLGIEALSALARIGSGSAARSIHGGWVSWDGPEAQQVASAEHWDVAMAVAILDAGPKDVGSREGMNRSRDTSPFYAAWVQNAQRLHEEGVEALLTRDLPRLVTAMEASTLRMHAVAMTSDPPVIYWTPQTWALLAKVRTLRESSGLECGFTMDAGPNVKVLCRGGDVEHVAEVLRREAGVQEVLVCRPGGPVAVEVQGRAGS